MDALHQKYQNLLEILRGYGSAAVAFSGGVDSTFLLAAAKEALGEGMLAVTASSCSFPARELEEAERFCRERGIRHIVARSGELDNDEYRRNPENRCYLCKKEIFRKLQEIAADHGLAAVAEGSNLDDDGDYRPGLIAIKELGVKSPLKEARLTKAEIRELSREMGLSTWDKPSFACLATRFVYGETISEEKLSMVERAEQLLVDLGFLQLRVRIHGRLARIELLPEDFPRLLEEETRTLVYRKFREFGFSYISLDLLGYRTGSMNETIKRKE